MKVVAIVQARMGSSRLPGKVLQPIAGRPMIDWVLARTAGASLVDECIVATTVGAEDDVLVRYLEARGGCGVFRGSAPDVLERYACCASSVNADIIVRVTADDPLKDPGVIDDAIRAFREPASCDYCSNTITPTFPEGLDIEVVGRDSLDRAHREAQLASEREHVTPYIWKRPDSFVVRQIMAPRNLSDWRWTVDREPDMQFMQAVLSEFGARPLTPYLEIVAWLEAHPEIRAINANIVRNEGYLTSLAADQQ